MPQNKKDCSEWSCHSLGTLTSTLPPTHPSIHPAHVKSRHCTSHILAILRLWVKGQAKSMFVLRVHECLSQRSSESQVTYFKNKTKMSTIHFRQKKIWVILKATRFTAVSTNFTAMQPRLEISIHRHPRRGQYRQHLKTEERKKKNQKETAKVTLPSFGSKMPLSLSQLLYFYHLPEPLTFATSVTIIKYCIIKCCYLGKIIRVKPYLPICYPPSYTSNIIRSKL